MPSPFPGMDPYLEGYLWPDIHHDLASKIRAQLSPALAPRYVARIVVRTVIEQIESGEALGIMLPDVEVFRSRPPANGAPDPGGRVSPLSVQIAIADAIMPAPVIIPQPLTYEVKIPTVEIHDVAGGLLVTSIEILSPSNKRSGGWDEYQAKRRTVLQAQAHLLEIDLLRRGRRPVPTMVDPTASYFIFLTRAQRRDLIEAWPIHLHDRLPIVPVPLRAPDADIPLNLQTALDTIYEEARYDLSINYQEPPSPRLTHADTAWAERLLGVTWPKDEYDEYAFPNTA